MSLRKTTYRNSNYDAVHRDTTPFRFPLVAMALATCQHGLPEPILRRILLSRRHDVATLDQLLGRHEDSSAMPEQHLPDRSRAK